MLQAVEGDPNEPLKRHVVEMFVKSIREDRKFKGDGNRDRVDIELR